MSIQESVHEVSRCAALLHERLPRNEAEAVPEAAEIAALFSRHLDALATAVAARGALPEGELRTAFHEVAARSGLTDLADAASPGGVSRARAGVLALGLRTAETLDARLAPAAAPGGEPRHARPRGLAAHHS
ncbi:hypothetical protein [Streptomyces montanisoli]|uniref:Uncharacterized protein n=1 Tax=Streptomyces montanisoli TaxID=2798581 RepID=A0A940MKU6_9ACTN|nr:hypothetical protein [Streptomyces montanisoli]MBP0461996.1 hypothetical protein [Streptomyces montanisoli]